MNRIEDQEQSIKHLQQVTQQTDNAISLLRKNQANMANDIDEIKRDLQFLRGTVEESSLKSQKVLSETQTIQKQLAALFKEKEDLLQKIEAARVSGSANAQIPQQLNALKPSRSAAEELYSQAYEHFQAKDYKDARGLFEKFIVSYPGSDLADNAQYWIGDCYFREKKFEEAIAAFQEVIKNFPQGNKVPDAYYKQALAFIALNEPLTAKILLEKVVSEYPSGSTASLAQEKLAELQ